MIHIHLLPSKFADWLLINMHVFSHQQKQRINNNKRTNQMFPTGPFVTSWLRGLINPTVPLTSFSGRLWHILPWKKHPPRMVEHGEGGGERFLWQFLFPVLSKKWCFQHVGKVKRWKHLAIPWCYSIYIYLQSCGWDSEGSEVCLWMMCSQKRLHDSTTNCDGLKLRKSCWDSGCLVINEMSTISASKSDVFCPLIPIPSAEVYFFSLSRDRCWIVFFCL